MSGLRLLEFADEQLRLFFGRGFVARLYEGNLVDARRAGRKDVFRLEMLEQRIEAGILRNDVKVSGRVCRRQLPDIERDVEVEGVLAVAGNPHILAIRSHALQCGSDLERHLRLACADEHENLEVVMFQRSQGFGLDALEIDQDVVSTHKKVNRLKSSALCAFIAQRPR